MNGTNNLTIYARNDDGSYNVGFEGEPRFDMGRDNVAGFISEFGEGSLRYNPNLSQLEQQRLANTLRSDLTQDKINSLVNPPSSFGSRVLSALFGKENGNGPNQEAQPVTRPPTPPTVAGNTP